MTLTESQREFMISDIEGLQPPDHDSRSIREAGQRLLGEALAEHWRELPDELLYEFHSVIMKNE